MRTTVRNQNPNRNARKSPAARITGQNQSRLVDLNALDPITRRAVQHVIYRMPEQGKRAMVHAANIEAMLDATPGDLTEPFFVGYDVEEHHNSEIAHNRAKNIKSEVYFNQHGKPEPSDGTMLSVVGALDAYSSTHDPLNG